MARCHHCAPIAAPTMTSPASFEGCRRRRARGAGRRPGGRCRAGTRHWYPRPPPPGIGCASRQWPASCFMDSATGASGARRSEIAPLLGGLGKRLIAPGRLRATAGGVTSRRVIGQGVASVRGNACSPRGGEGLGPEVRAAVLIPRRTVVRTDRVVRAVIRRRSRSVGRGRGRRAWSGCGRRGSSRWRG